MPAEVEPPYEGIADALTHGEVIPFLGSAASLSDVGRHWSDGAADCLPTAKELALHLAKKGNYPKEVGTGGPGGVDVNGGRSDPAPDEVEEHPIDGERVETLPEDPWVPELRKSAQYITLTLGRPRLIRYLDDIFRAKPPLGRLHHYLAGLASPGGEPLILITTNYDDLLERAFDEQGKSYLLVVHTTGRDRGEKLLVRESGGTFREEDANQIAQVGGLDAVIYKMHGSIRRADGESGEYVITDDDYVDFLARMTRWTAIPAVINRPLRLRSFLFLGYGLEDWNLRVLLSQLAANQRQPEDELGNWAIQKGPSLFDQSYWRKKGVEVYDMTIQKFVAQLEALVDSDTGSP